MRFGGLITAVACAVAVSGLAPAAAHAAGSLSVAAPGMTGAVNDIACPSTKSCWAVGDGMRGDNGYLRFVARIMHFDGKTWTTLKVPVPAAVAAPHGHVTGDDPLSGVTCTSTKNCWAVGSTTPGDSTAYKYLVLHWDGRHWTTVPVATPSGASGALSSVACVTATNCWAVGNVSRRVFEADGQILHWDGHRWRAVATPVSFALSQVRCERGQCWAVGDGSVTTNGASASTAVLLQLVGAQWVSLLPSVPLTSLSTVACPGASSCWLTGLAANHNGLLHWDGTTLAPGGVPSAKVGDGAVTCASASSCWFSPGQEKPARMYHWNGTTWKAFATPTVHTGRIYQISCASTKLCWAGGTAGSGYHYNVVLLRWNGKRWTRSL